MGIDSNIALGYKAPEFQDPLNSLAKMMQMQHLQNQNDQYQRGITDQNELRSALSGGGDVYNSLLKLGKVKEAGDYRKSEGEYETQKLTRQNTTFDLQNKVIASYRDASGSIADPLSAREFVSMIHADPRLKDSAITRVPLDKLLQQIPEDPAQFGTWKQQFALGATKFIEQNKPVIRELDNGQVKTVQSYPGLGGAPTTWASVQKVATPGEVLADSRGRDLNQATRDAAVTTAQATRDAANIQTGYKNEQGLRKEFEDLPEVKNYKQALPAYKGVEDAVKRNTTQSDINIVYGIAKLYDPTSVVREGEYATVANSPNIPERIKGYAQYLAGGGKLSPETKAEILAEAKSRMGSYEAEHGKARKNYESIAQRSGVDASRVFPSPLVSVIAPDAKAKPGKSAAALPAGWTVKEH